VAYLPPGVAASESVYTCDDFKEEGGSLGTEVEHNRRPMDQRHREVVGVAPETLATVPAGREHGQDQKGGQAAEEVEIAKVVGSGGHRPGILVGQMDRIR
jgi:hypothetical protein